LLASGITLEVMTGFFGKQRMKDGVKMKFADGQVFRTLAETASDAIITIDEEDNILFVNRAGEKIFGYTVTEMVGQKLKILMPEHLRKTHEDSIKRYLETGKRRIRWEAVETLGLHKSGKEIPLEISFGEFKKNGRHFFTGIVRDVTGRKRAEERLGEYEENLKGLVEVRTGELKKINEQLKQEISERKRMEEELEKLVITDRLTQAYNRVKFDEIIKVEMERVERYGHLLSMEMLDIDNLKEINDTHGHNVGDYVLRTVADLIKENMRTIDYLIRWGGDEFMIIAPETDLQRTGALAERIRKTIEGYRFDSVGRVTVSFGVTQFIKGDSEKSFIKRADDALYRAKSNGRNRVEIIV
jgi:diguanylate cyclase (GGDEF)-like protein/PAS domain S-box-containing protein